MSEGVQIVLLASVSGITDRYVRVSAVKGMEIIHMQGIGGGITGTLMDGIVQNELSVGTDLGIISGFELSVPHVSSLIKAYSPLKQMAKLVIIGDGECRGDLEKLDRKLETKAIFVGRKEGDELLAWYNIADIFVLPSVQEAFGAVTNEALLAGCYTLVSEKAGSSSIIHSGFNGEIFNPHSTIELTQLLKIQINKLDSKDNIKLKDNLMPYSFVNMLDRALQGIVGS